MRIPITLIVIVLGFLAAGCDQNNGNNRLAKLENALIKQQKDLEQTNKQIQEIDLKL